MSKLFHVTLQKWKALTGDLLETLKWFLLLFPDHLWWVKPPQSDCSDPQHKNILLFQFFHASLQALHVEVAMTVEVIHFLPQDMELHQMRCHLCLQERALLSRTHRFRVAEERRFLNGELHRFKPGFQASEGPQNFHNLRSREADDDWLCVFAHDGLHSVKQWTKRDNDGLPEAVIGFHHLS